MTRYRVDLLLPCLSALHPHHSIIATVDPVDDYTVDSVQLRSREDRAHCREIAGSLDDQTIAEISILAHDAIREEEENIIAELRAAA